MGNKIYVFGHKKPDTDSITSSIVLANLQKALGNDATAYKLGSLNKETKYALKTFEVEEPKTLESVDADCDVMLVDHNEATQSANGIENANIKMVVDHHKIKFETSEPVYYVAEPVGCTASILYKLYKQNDVEINSQIAGLMLSAI
ncbi:MAG: DHH family phosphoesterase, partial [Clostridia bacterium]